MRTLLVFLLTVSLASSIADANGSGNGTGSGGGGTKPTALIKVRNNGNSLLAVIVDPSSDIEEDLDAGTLTTVDFIRAGGRFVGRKGLTAFGGLQAGTHTVAAAYVSNASNNATVSTAETVEVDVSQGQTRTVTATGSVSSGVTFNGP